MSVLYLYDEHISLWDPSDFHTFVCVCVCYRLYFECVHIETIDNINFYSESVVYINDKGYEPYSGRAQQLSDGGMNTKLTVVCRQRR